MIKNNQKLSKLIKKELVAPSLSRELSELLHVISTAMLGNIKELRNVLSSEQFIPNFGESKIFPKGDRLNAKSICN